MHVDVNNLNTLNSWDIQSLQKPVDIDKNGSMMMMTHKMCNIEIVVGSPVFAVPSLKSAQCGGRELCIHAQHQTGVMLQSQALCCLTFMRVL